MSDSILNSIKQALDLEVDDNTFDFVLKMHINSVFSHLYQIGVTPKDGFVISDDTKVWTDYLGSLKDVEDVKSYMYLKVKVIFDPPTTSFLLDHYSKMIQEMETRLSYREIVFNPMAFKGNIPIPYEVPTVWEIDEREELPKDMAEGEVAFDPVTGAVIRKI